MTLQAYALHPWKSSFWSGVDIIKPDTSYFYDEWLLRYSRCFNNFFVDLTTPICQLCLLRDLTTRHFCCSKWSFLHYKVILTFVGRCYVSLLARSTHTKSSLKSNNLLVVVWLTYIVWKTQYVVRLNPPWRLRIAFVNFVE